MKCLLLRFYEVIRIKIDPLGQKFYLTRNKILNPMSLKYGIHTQEDDHE